MHPPYSGFEEHPGKVVGFVKALDLEADLDLLVAHWCRLRCGIPLLRHQHGREGGARFQDCIFCGKSTGKPVIHCVASCPHWCTHRQRFSAAIGVSPEQSQLSFTVQFLSTGHTKGTMSVVLQWARDIDRGA